MPMRFLIDVQPRLDADIELNAERSHYLRKVLRHKRGDTIACFDGHGTAFDAELVEAHTKQSVLRIVNVAEPAASPTHRLELGLGLLKGQAMDRALQQATELGATTITLIATERSNVSLSKERAANKLMHWQKIVDGACEQSGHLYVPGVSLAPNIGALITDSQAQIAILDMHGIPLPQELPACDRLLLVGPEGGWSDGERALFKRQNSTCYRLTDNTLRAETVPAVALAMFKHLMGDF